MVGALTIMLMFGGVFSLLLRGHAHPWNPRLGNMRVRRARGPSFGTVLAVAGLATLLLKAAELPIMAAHPGVILWLIGAVRGWLG